MAKAQKLESCLEFFELGRTWLSALGQKPQLEVIARVQPPEGARNQVSPIKGPPGGDTGEHLQTTIQQHPAPCLRAITGGPSSRQDEIPDITWFTKRIHFVLLSKGCAVLDFRGIQGF
jgi:hypothetical protein